MRLSVYALIRLNRALMRLCNRDAIAEHIRFSSPWEFDNTVWTYLSFIKGFIEGFIKGHSQKKL